MSAINRLGMSPLGAALASPLGAERRYAPPPCPCPLLDSRTDMFYSLEYTPCAGAITCQYCTNQAGNLLPGAGGSGFQASHSWFDEQRTFLGGSTCTKWLVALGYDLGYFYSCATGIQIVGDYSCFSPSGHPCCDTAHAAGAHFYAVAGIVCYLDAAEDGYLAGSTIVNMYDTLTYALCGQATLTVWRTP